MKNFLTFLLSLSLICFAVYLVYISPRPYDTNTYISNNQSGVVEVPFYIVGRDISNTIKYINDNFQANGKNIRFKAVNDPGLASITVRFQQNIGSSYADAMSYPIVGIVYIRDNILDKYLPVVLTHEACHCVGIGHRPDNPGSIMFTNSQEHAEIKDSDIEKLKTLADINMLGRLKAQWDIATKAAILSPNQLAEKHGWGNGIACMRNNSNFQYINNY